MYTDGLVTAIVIGIVALAAPALWVTWWLVADLGERVAGAPRQAYRRKRRPVISEG
jgi:hypothetical protein